MEQSQGSLPSFNVLGVPVSITNLEHACDTITGWAGDRTGRFICIRDVHGIVQAVDNKEVMALHGEAAMVTPDGMPLVWLGKSKGHAISRTCGPDLMDRLLEKSVKSGLKHYFLGGKEGVADALKQRFTGKYPGLQVVGTKCPPYRPFTESEILDLAKEIDASGADVVWVGISTPKQEFLMRDLRKHVGATLIGVGAAFDVHAGLSPRAPKWMQTSGLEWSYRLAKEPGRLWRRYLVMAPRFVWLLATSR